MVLGEPFLGSNFHKKEGKLSTRLSSCWGEGCEAPVYKPFLQGPGPLLPRQLMASVSFWAWGRCGPPKGARKLALSLHVLILSASTSLDFLRFSALTLPPSPAPNWLLCVNVTLCQITVSDLGTWADKTRACCSDPAGAPAAMGQLEADRLSRPRVTHPALPGSVKKIAGVIPFVKSPEISLT